MILSASTLGAPNCPLSAVLEQLHDAAVGGIELRLAAGEIAEPGMSADRIDDVRSQLDRAGVQLTGLASYVRIAAPGPDDEVVRRLAEALVLARDLGAPAVRVFPGAPVEDLGFTAVPRLLEPDDEVRGRAARRLSLVAALAERYGVLPVLETHDSHPSGSDIARIAELVDGPVGVVWDIMHPWRVGEPLESTWSSLKPWLSRGLGSVQIKDAAAPSNPTPTRIGEGSLPCDEFARLLLREGYAGTVALELEAAWYPTAPDFRSVLASARAWFESNSLAAADRGADSGAG